MTTSCILRVHKQIREHFFHLPIPLFYYLYNKKFGQELLLGGSNLGTNFYNINKKTILK